MKTIQEVKNAKKKLEQDISSLIAQFEKKMGYRYLRWKWKPLVIAMALVLMWSTLR